MADKPAFWFRRINNKLDTLDSNMDGLYQSTYSSRSDNKKDMDRIVSSIDDTIDRLMNNGNGPKISDISNLYIRMQKKQGISNSSILNGAMELFSDNSVINALSVNQETNRYIQAEDYQYDMICKYMPSIETALEIKRDNVLSSDNFTKDFLNITSDATSEKRFAVFNDRAIRVKEKYKFQDICEEMYERASRYGEAFVYIVPYKVAFQRLLDRRSQFSSIGFVKSFGESSTRRKITYPQSKIIFESTKLDEELSMQLKIQNLQLNDNFSVNLVFDDYGIFAEGIEAKQKSMEILESAKLNSLTEAYNVLQEAKHGEEKDPAVQFDSVYSNRKSSHTLDGGVNDGLIIRGSKGYNTSNEIKDMTGCVVNFIERADIIPIYMDNLCVGYYHFMFTDALGTCIHGNPNGTINAVGMNRGNTVEMSEVTNDMLLSYIAQQLSLNIDAHFINANKDLKEEIYAILKHNDKFNMVNGTNTITVSFLPVDDVYHFYLKQNKKTHRGISSIYKSVVPAMLYCLLYLTNTIGQVTRAQDKRIYYVKQNVETNVARTLMNVINQIKKGNMGMRQIQSMNSILNIVGKYNDHVIPVGQSGDAPIQFEVMQGQEINTPSELMDRFENLAVEGTDVPYEFVQSVNQVDYATRFTMSNSKFLRKVYKEQRICQEAFSYIFTKIYNYEYNENEHGIKVILPAPAFLTMTNSEQLVNNTKNFVNAIIESEIPNESDEVKAEFSKIMIRNYLGSYIDYTKVDDAITKARLNVNFNKSNNGDGEE